MTDQGEVGAQFALGLKYGAAEGEFGISCNQPNGSERRPNKIIPWPNSTLG